MLNKYQEEKVHIKSGNTFLGERIDSCFEFI